MPKLQPTIVQHIVDTQGIWFEQMVLARLLYDNEFYGKASRILCAPLSGGRIEDFREPTTTAIYLALESYHQVYGARPPVMTDDFALAAFTQMSQAYKAVISPEDITECLNRLTAIRRINLEVSAPMVVEGFAYWLTKRRTFVLIRTHTAEAHWDPQQLLADVKAQLQGVGLVQSKDTFFEYGHGQDNRILDVARIPIPGLTGLTKALGGGLARGEGYLFISPQSGGKTVLGCQLADTLCESVRQTGIYITTEQGHEELEPRIVSNVCGIPFAGIKDGFDPRTFNPDQQRRYEEHRDRIRGRLFFEDWNKEDRSRTIVNDLHSVVDQRQQEMGKKIDFLIFDWIGSALGKMDKNNLDKLRFVYQEAADTIAWMARDKGIYTIAFSQAAMGQAVNKKRIDASMIAECKNMGQNFTGVIGITAMFLDGQVPGDNDEPIFDPRQWFYVSKARKGVGGCTPFYRQFEYQRMADIHSRPRPQ
jgi:KaiC/GvpD/RAD55 family RecA-like ATPase